MPESLNPLLDDPSYQYHYVVVRPIPEFGFCCATAVMREDFKIIIVNPVRKLTEKTSTESE